jgi:hypothetical protein
MSQFSRCPRLFVEFPELPVISDRHPVMDVVREQLPPLIKATLVE